MEIDDDTLELIINARIMNFKNDKNIKKYIKIRTLHSKILSNMIDYFEYNNFNLHFLLKEIMKQIDKNDLKFKLELSSLNENDINCLYDLAIYNNELKIKSITEEYIGQKKIKSKENKMMLESMNRSYLGLFSLIEINRKEAYLILEDVFSHKKIKVITLSLSLIERTNIYIFTRIITYNEISFLTGLTLTFDSNNKLIKEYIKIYQNVKLSPARKYLSIYHLYQKDNNKLNINTSYI